MNKLVPTALFSIAAFALSPVTLAHHSQSEFDFKSRVEFEGTVTKVEWRSPHARVYVDVKDDKGATVNWDFELPSPTTLMRRGWKRDSLKLGDHIKIAGVRARNFPTIGLADSIIDATGKPMFTGTTQIYEPEAEKSESESQK
ncbi:MAG TPA: DUF6152 family protein [Candidatus Acidoferrum sp.]|nr:DUF6152 family protein [Candidatus Acidoferrum sp.]